MALDEDRLLKTLSSITLAILTERSLAADLERLARVTCRLVERCSGASISMIIDGDPTTVAVTDRITLELDMVQYQHDDGPCVTALTGQAIRIGYTPNEDRFPHFAVGAADRRVLSVLSTPTIHKDTVVGSLNLYSRDAEAFDEVAEAMAWVFATEVGQAIAKSSLLTKVQNMRELLQEEHDESTLVARAQELVMTANECSADQARTIIRAAADTNGEPIVDTAERILSSLLDPGTNETLDEPVRVTSDETLHDPLTSDRGTREDPPEA